MKNNDAIEALNRLGNGAINKHVYDGRVNEVKEEVKTIRTALEQAEKDRDAARVSAWVAQMERLFKYCETGERVYD